MLFQLELEGELILAKHQILLSYYMIMVDEWPDVCVICFLYLAPSYIFNHTKILFDNMNLNIGGPLNLT